MPRDCLSYVRHDATALESRFQTGQCSDEALIRLSPARPTTQARPCSGAAGPAPASLAVNESVNSVVERTAHVWQQRQACAPTNQRWRRPDPTSESQ
ncbi:hypothetical protein CSUI_008017 [Cystoisospora suis]|uniref:Uncharacterized protein n=1 Tax=Cystoisospora suis TaxID=483139 RepID=A0A2C6JRD0_9APIC|nr:hypothetical protein CSUI_008017 [Cystoisospora suis]